jgi:hypothetical protein
MSTTVKPVFNLPAGCPIVYPNLHKQILVSPSYLLGRYRAELKRAGGIEGAETTGAETSGAESIPNRRKSWSARDGVRGHSDVAARSESYWLTAEWCIRCRGLLTSYWISIPHRISGIISGRRRQLHGDEWVHETTVVMTTIAMAAMVSIWSRPFESIADQIEFLTRSWMRSQSIVTHEP